MEALIRRKLSMAADALQFAQSHPSTDAGYLAVVAKLQEQVARADALAIQQQDTTDAERAAVVRRNALRRTIQRGQLKHLVRVAQEATQDHPDLAGAFVYPTSHGAIQKFVTAAKSLLAAAAPQKDLFVTLGLGETFVDDLTQSVAQFDTLASASHTNRQGHIGARADLGKVAAACIRMVAVIDGFNRTRFADDAELLAEWESASRVTPRRTRAGAAVPSPVPAPVQAPASSAPIQAAA